MCQHVFIASDCELPEVAWREDEPAFHTERLDDSDRGVLAQFSKPHVLYLGASTGCSCGFIGPSNDVSAAQLQENIDRLVGYVSAAARESDLEIYACWAGYETAKPDEQLTLFPSQLVDTSAWCGETVLIRIAKILN